MIQSIRCSDDYSPEPASEIGDIHVKEYVPTMAKHTIAVSHMTLYAKSLRSEVGTYTDGTTMLQGLTFDIEVCDQNSVPLRKYIGCSYASGDVDVSAHKVVVSNATFNALDVSGTGV